MYVLTTVKIVPSSITLSRLFRMVPDGDFRDIGLEVANLMFAHNTRDCSTLKDKIAMLEMSIITENKAVDWYNKEQRYRDSDFLAFVVECLKDKLSALRNQLKES